MDTFWRHLVKVISGSLNIVLMEIRTKLLKLLVITMGISSQVRLDSHFPLKTTELNDFVV